MTPLWKYGDKLALYMTPHFMSITFRITSNKDLHFDLKMIFKTNFAWWRNARRLHRDICVQSQWEGFSTQTQGGGGGVLLKKYTHNTHIKKLKGGGGGGLNPKPPSPAYAPGLEYVGILNKNDGGKELKCSRKKRVFEGIFVWANWTITYLPTFENKT